MIASGMIRYTERYVFLFYLTRLIRVADTRFDKSLSLTALCGNETLNE
jgi:hypothetical protein